MWDLQGIGNVHVGFIVGLGLLENSHVRFIMGLGNFGPHRSRIPWFNGGIVLSRSCHSLHDVGFIVGLGDLRAHQS